MDERTTYRDDFYGWSQEQAAVLRRLQNRRDLPKDLDLAHVIEEIVGVGGNELHAVQSYLRLIFVHLIKTASARNPEAQTHWRAEVIGFHADLLTRYSRSMGQNIDLDVVWRRALKQAEAALAEHGESLGKGAENACPFHLSDFTREDIELDALLARTEAALATSG